MAEAVADNSIVEAQKLLAQTEGIFAAPEGAATLAALFNLKERGWLGKDERIVLFNTGTGLKYLD
jgi:threonine synthase